MIVCERRYSYPPKFPRGAGGGTDTRLLQSAQIEMFGRLSDLIVYCRSVFRTNDRCKHQWYLHNVLKASFTCRTRTQFGPRNLRVRREPVCGAPTHARDIYLSLHIFHQNYRLPGTVHTSPSTDIDSCASRRQSASVLEAYDTNIIITIDG